MPNLTLLVCARRRSFISAVTTVPCVLIALLVAGPSTAVAAEYFVAKTGNNSNPGTKTSPYLTVAYGMSVLKPGDTLTIRAGLYNESVSAKGSGTSAQPITVRGYPGETVTLKYEGGDRTTWTGGRSTFYMSGVSFWILRNLTISNHSVDSRYPPGSHVGGTLGGYGSPLSQWGVKDILIEDVVLTSEGGGGQWNDEASQRITFRRVRAHGVGWVGFDRPHGHGLYINGSDHVIEDSVLENNAFSGAQVYPLAERVTFRRTKALRNGANGIYFGTVGDKVGGRSSNHLVINCLIAGNKNYGVGFGALDVKGNRVLNSTFYQNGPLEVYVSTNGDPLVPRISEFSNNILVSSSNGKFFTGSLGTTVRNNLFFKAGGSMPSGAGENAVWGDPGFVSVTHGDFRLKQGSLAINRGVSLLPIVTEDFARVQRPQDKAFDIGAYEYQSGTATEPIPETPTSFEVQ